MQCVRNERTVAMTVTARECPCTLLPPSPAAVRCEFIPAARAPPCNTNAGLPAAVGAAGGQGIEAEA
eukprot:6739192-Pyramimonas_sp.AAC.1